MKIEFPPDIAQRTIANEAGGGACTQANLTAPTIVRPGQPFALRIALTDSRGLAVVNHPPRLRIITDTGLKQADVHFDAGRPALAVVHGLVCDQPGYHRFKTQIDAGIFYSNPILCSAAYTDGIFWGDPHIHSALSNCMLSYSRSLSFGLHAARYLSGLDWAGVADHVSNGRCEPARWKEQSRVADAHDDPPGFATLPAYEASLKGGAGGDNNVYLSSFPSAFVDEHDAGNTRTICEKLEQNGSREGFDFFIAPHHTTRTGKHGEISADIYPGPHRMPVLEIHSKWGTSEYRGNPHPLHKIHPGPSYAVDLLAGGMPFGFIGGTDTHATMTFARGDLEAGHLDRLPGLTAAVCADGLNRRNVFDALRTRHCYAAAGERIFLDLRVNGAGMGQTTATSAEDRHITLKTAVMSAMDTVDIIRNGQVWRSFAPGNWFFETELRDTDSFAGLAQPSPYIGDHAYYYARVRSASGGTAWSSPIWVTR